MTLAEIRTTLLQQHHALRVKIEDARRLTQLWSSGEYPRDDLQRFLQALSDQLRAHNACEEELLSDVLPTIDAWGQARSEVMTAEHLDEHRNLCAGLLGSTLGAEPKAGAAGITSLLDAMLEHMKHEEQIFLAADVLTDDIAVGDSFGG